jgi:uncharacterized membrane protein YedE/YeeE
MMVSMTSLLAALAGGALIGLSATVLLLVSGRVAGISGIVGGLFDRRGDRGWRVAFLGGLLAGAVVLALVAPSTVAAVTPAPRWLVVVAGLLVGVGTTLGNGCTSGHGVYGISRLSPRSLVATGVVMATGVVAATLGRIALGVGS